MTEIKQEINECKKALNKSVLRSIPSLLLNTTIGIVLSTASMPAFAAFDIPTGAPASPLFGAQPFAADVTFRGIRTTSDTQ